MPAGRPAVARPVLAAGLFALAALAAPAQSPPVTKGGQPDPFKPTDPAAAEAVYWLDARAAEQRFPLQFDAGRAKAVRDAATAWYLKVTVGAFDKVGNTAAPWADKARAGLEAWARGRATAQLHNYTDQPLDDAARRTLQAAVDAGCDDPMVHYAWFRLRDRAGEADEDEDHRETLRTAAGLYQSGYPDARKIHAAYNAYVHLRNLGNRRTAAEKKDTKVWGDRFWELFDKNCGDPDPHVQYDLADLARLALNSRYATYEEIAARLERGKASACTRNLFKGRYLIGHAWAARGSGYAGSVTEQGWKDFHERLEGSRAALTAAWESDKTRWEAPTDMITVCKGLQKGLPTDRAEMETWFARAMAANPDNTQAVTLKLDHLLPKWGGSMEEHLGFGWQCIRTGNTAGYVTWAPVAFHTTQAPYFGLLPDLDRDGLRAFYGHPAVWQQVETACQLRLADRPDDWAVRATYAQLATIAGRYDAAVREFDKLGDKPSPGAFASKKEQEAFRKWAKDKTPPPAR